MTEPKRTPLADVHKTLGARMIEFGGWLMPVSYPTGILEEHRTVRERVGLFDVSHMGEIELQGRGAAEAVEKLVTRRVSALEPGRAAYTVACLPSGGALDDLIVYRLAEDRFLIVVNASNIEKDYRWFVEHATSGAQVVDRSEEFGLLALQGPLALASLEPIWNGPGFGTLRSFGIVQGQISGIPVLASRTGYTGEDGLELFVETRKTAALYEALLDHGAKPCGLGARDTLRLEARLCLYGHELDEHTTPLEAGLSWVVDWEETDFIGKPALLAQRAAGPQRKLVGFVMQERGIARHGYGIFDEGGRPLGNVTSGGPSPSTGQNIGLGFVPTGWAQPGKTVWVDCRGKRLSALIRKGAFYQRGQS